MLKYIEIEAEDYLAKPVNSIFLQARVNASLKKRLRNEQRKMFETPTSSEVAESLMVKGFELVNVSVMFIDIRPFTTLSEKQSPSETIELLNIIFSMMFEPINDHHGIVNQILDDRLMAIFGAPIHRDDHCHQAVLAAQEMLEVLNGFNQEQGLRNDVQLQIGIASGEAVAGYTGTQQRAIFTCIGDIVNLASRLESHTKEWAIKFCWKPIRKMPCPKLSKPFHLDQQL